ncbi:MAG: hypothetical protein CME36_19695 [unclassified Hahellaceae]|nr:hypothetical protein [Hahellaceae bacterium]
MMSTMTHEKRTLVLAWGTPVIIMVGIFGYFISDWRSPEQIAKDSLYFEFSRSKDKYLNFYEVDFAFSNNSDFTIDEIEVRCTHFAKNGTKLESRTGTVSVGVDAMDVTIMLRFDMGIMPLHTDKTNCIVSDLKLKT